MKTNRMTFIEKLDTIQKKNKSWVCVGLDTDPEKIPAALRTKPDGVIEFNRAIIQATQDLVCAYKPNLAFYLMRGSRGINELQATIAAIPRDIPIVLDAKFGDIDSTAKNYARFAYNILGVDAVTINPYLGADALMPFLESADHAIFVLAHTSNPTAKIFQDQIIGNEPLYIHVAKYAQDLSGLIGLVVGATFPEQLRDARAANPNAIFLIPGIGAQGGSISDAVKFGKTAQGIGALINASRSILYASSGEDFSNAARAATIKMRDEIGQANGQSVIG